MPDEDDDIDDIFDSLGEADVEALSSNKPVSYKSGYGHYNTRNHDWWSDDRGSGWERKTVPTSSSVWSIGTTPRMEVMKRLNTAHYIKTSQGLTEKSSSELAQIALECVHLLLEQGGAQLKDNIANPETGEVMNAEDFEHYIFSVIEANLERK